MSLKKVIIASCMFLGLTGFSILANAQGLHIVNNTSKDSTSRINGGTCSSIFGSSGITKAHATNDVSETLVKLACLTNSQNCRADVYVTDDCSGPMIGTVFFDTKAGTKSVEMNSTQYLITSAPGSFEFVLSE